MQAKLFLRANTFIILLFFYSTVASAAPMDQNVLDLVLEKYESTASTWGNIMLNYASWLFWSLVLISMVWTFGMMILKKSDIQEFLAETIRFLAVTSFFWWFLYNGPAISNSIIESMWMIGAKAIGQESDFKPSGIVQIGLEIFFKILTQGSVWAPVDSACGIIMGLIILIIFTVIGVNLLLLFVSAWILIYGSIFFLGFGGSSWTSDIVINFYKTVLAVGAQLMTMLLLIGIGKSFVDQYYANMMGALNLKELGVILVAAIVLLNLTDKIPPMIAGIVGVGGAGSIGNFGASAALSGAAMATAAAATVGNADVSGASSLAGGASALKSAFQQAQQHMSEGSGMFSGSNGKSASRGSGGFKSAMNTAGKFAADMGATLAKGSMGVAKDKIESIKDAVKERISETTGGKVVSKIKDLDSPQLAQDVFTGDSLGAGKNNSSTMSSNEEVSNFVNKNHSH